MSGYVLSCESTTDLSLGYLEELGLSVICYHFEVDGDTFTDDFGKSMALPDFYQRIRDGAVTRTSQIGIMEYMDYFESLLQQGKDVLHVAMSSGISGSCNSAMLAAKDLKEKYPDQKMEVVDSLAASSGYGMLMSRLSALKSAGMSLEELRNWTEAHRLECYHWFFTADLTYLIRGGRVSRTAGYMGQLLNICPLMHVDTRGALEVREKVRTKKKVMRTALEHMKTEAENGTDYSRECFISQADCLEDAKTLAEMLEETFPKLKGKIRIFDIGTTIGSHTGPGLIALFFWGGKARED